jgi:glyoxylase-like metal-dependent hydrolase (beta-lactamase superfamily II)
MVLAGGSSSPGTFMGEIQMTLSRRDFMTTAAAAGLAPLALAVPRPAQAAAPVVGKQVAGFYRYKVGDFEVTGLNDGFSKVPKLEAFVVNKPQDEIEKAIEAAYIPKDDLRVPFNPLVINTGKNLVLFDTGFGDNGPPTTGGLMNNLAAAGIDPKAIDTVIISHFHPDHISGLRAKAGAANFPNAEITVPAGEWTYWNDSSEIDKTLPAWKGAFANVKRVFDPIAKDVKQFEFGKEIVPGITSVDARGHSPGHTAFVIASGSAKLMYIADVTNHPVLFARNPEWRLWADMIPDQALTTRRKLLDMLAAERMPMAGYHYPFPAVGYIAKQGTGYDFVPDTWRSM